MNKITFKSYINWINQMITLGDWDIETCLICVKILIQVIRLPLYKREREWRAYYICLLGNTLVTSGDHALGEMFLRGEWNE